MLECSVLPRLGHMSVCALRMREHWLTDDVHWQEEMNKLSVYSCLHLTFSRMSSFNCYLLYIAARFVPCHCTSHSAENKYE